MRTRLVVNPAAGAGRAAARACGLRPRLEAALGPLEWRESRSAEHLTELVAEVAQRGDPRVLLAGGDGAVHFAANALVGTDTALGILSVGTGNDIAASVGMPRDPEGQIDETVAILAAGHVRRLDVGEATSERGLSPRGASGAAGFASRSSRRRVYVCVLGVGMDTEALERINSARLLRRGRLLYTLAALRTVLTYKAPAVSIAWGESETSRWRGEVVFAAVTNTKSYAGGMKITPLADVEDGLLDLCVIPRLPLPRLLARFGRVLKGRHVGMSGIVMAQSPLFHISSESPLPVTLDGELTDLTTPLDVRVLPGALPVIGAPVASLESHELVLEGAARR
jgi:diacylglycerol kinase (ATP)